MGVRAGLKKAHSTASVSHCGCVTGDPSSRSAAAAGGGACTTRVLGHTAGSTVNLVTWSPLSVTQVMGDGRVWQHSQDWRCSCSQVPSVQRPGGKCLTCDETPLCHHVPSEPLQPTTQTTGRVMGDSTKPAVTGYAYGPPFIQRTWAPRPKQ